MIRATLALLVLCFALPAFAFNELWAKHAPITKMTDEDMKIAGAAIRKALDEGAEGQAYPWSNPATKASGTVTPVKSLVIGGRQCRKVDFETRAGDRSNRSSWNICKTKDGWKVASGA